jgi:serine/threonine protein kinase
MIAGEYFRMIQICARPALTFDSLTVTFDSLTHCSLVFRDLKPDNVGVNLRGDYMLFDFGLAKELKKKDLVQAPDSFKATGLTGSRRYMAPEVVLSDNYGFSVDVYSFGLVFWETMALKIPYGKGLSVAKHFQEVVQQGRRPDTSKTRKIISPRLQSVMEACWSSPSTRPNFDAICEDLRAEIACGGAGDRTSHLFDKSINSKAGLD